MSVSTLVSQISLAQKAASKKAQQRLVASGTAAPAVQVEWSRLLLNHDFGGVLHHFNELAGESEVYLSSCFRTADIQSVERKKKSTTRARG